MVRFDKIKFIAPIEAIDCYEQNPIFEKTTKNGYVIRYKFSHDQLNLHIIVTPQENKFSMEFTGKILQEHYPLLINKNTIKECIERIINMGVCKLNIDKILELAEVCQCDITSDINFSDESKFRTVVSSYLNSPKWVVKKYSGGFSIEKTVKTAKYRRRLAIYNKEIEMRKKANLDFLSNIDDQKEVIEYFQGKTRLELNLTSMKAIRDSLHIENTKLMTVLNSTANPIREVFMDSVRLPKEEKVVTSLRDYERLIVLGYFNNDLSILRERICPFFKRSTSANKVISEYRKLIDSEQIRDFTWIYEILNQVA